MNESTHLENIARMEELFDAEGSYTASEHPTFRRVLHFNFTPCCFPLETVLWVNPASNGIFIRILFPSGLDARSSGDVFRRLNEINYSLPVGALVVSDKDGQLIFQNAIVIGDAVVDRGFAWEFLASSCDMVSSRFDQLIELASGAKHDHEKQRSDE